ncbi:MAG: hypothetical protein WA874_05035 [Chryseosolibacter sp.]
MRKILLVGLCLVNFYGAYAQNKTLGVGVATPNPNAVLHVESPGGNQGFMMPRLTTVQRQAMNSLLTGTDKGLMLYDTDLNAVFIWDGLAWGTTSEVENLDPNSTIDAFTVLNTGQGTAARIKTNNTKSKMPVLWAETNSDSALSAPIYALNTGKGDVAASFRLTNPASPYPALFAESSGTGRTATFRKLGTTGSQPAVFVDSRGGHGIWADHNSATGYAAIFQTINTGNSNAGVMVESIGTGPSVWALKSTDAVSGEAFKAENWIANGSAATFHVTDVNNGSATISAHTAGVGSAGFFGQTNTEAWSPALMAQTAAQGAAFSAKALSASANANAAEFVVENPANTRNAIMAVSEGTGSTANFIGNNASSTAATVYVSNAGTGAGVQANTSTGFTAIYGRHEGAGNGNAGLFEITQATNTYPALQANTVGTGSAFNARHTGPSGDAVYAERAGAGNGSAGNFRVSDGSNNASALFGVTAAAGGTGIGASNEANGVAFAVWSGGVKIAAADVSTSSITTRASAYRLISGANFTLDFGPTDGEVFMIYNDTGASITIAGVTILNGDGKTLVVFPGGVIRGF